MKTITKWIAAQALTEGMLLSGGMVVRSVHVLNDGGVKVTTEDRDGVQETKTVLAATPAEVRVDVADDWTPGEADVVVAVETYDDDCEGTTTGHSGTETSAAAAPSRGKVQALVLAEADRQGRYGVTVAGLRRTLAGKAHHGSISSALTNLHRAGRLARLVEVRSGCKVYVIDGFVGGRPTEPAYVKNSATGRRTAEVGRARKLTEAMDIADDEARLARLEDLATSEIDRVLG